MAKTAQEIAAQIKALTKDPVEWDSLLLAQKLQPILDDILGSIPTVPSDVLTRSKDVATNLWCNNNKVPTIAAIDSLLEAGKLFGGIIDADVDYQLPDLVSMDFGYNLFFICTPGSYTYEYGPHPETPYVVPDGSLGFWYYDGPSSDPYVLKVVQVSSGGGGTSAPLFIDMSLYDHPSINPTNWQGLNQYAQGITKAQFESICKGEILQIKFAQGQSSDTDFMPIYTRAAELKAGSHSSPWNDTTYGQIFAGPLYFGITSQVALVACGMKIDNPDDPDFGTSYWIASQFS